jgi:hypothetical protein
MDDPLPESVELVVVVVVADDPVVVAILQSSSDGDLGPIKLVQITSPSLCKSHVLLDSMSSSSNAGHPMEVTLEDWLAAKKDILEWSLHLRSQSSCQGKTRKLEEKLLACNDKIVRFNM